MNTSFSYMYRDASNWKQHNTIILKGEISSLDIEAILSKLEQGEFFLPTQVGLVPLQQRWDELNEDDHIWHELTKADIELTQDKQTVDMTIEQLVANFKSIGNWHLTQAFNQLWGFPD